MKDHKSQAPEKEIFKKGKEQLRAGWFLGRRTTSATVEESIKAPLSARHIYHLSEQRDSGSPFRTIGMTFCSISKVKTNQQEEYCQKIEILGSKRNRRILLKFLWGYKPTLWITNTLFASEEKPLNICNLKGITTVLLKKKNFPANSILKKEAGKFSCFNFFIRPRNIMVKLFTQLWDWTFAPRVSCEAQVLGL